MSKLEKEVKILDINVNEVKSKLLAIGAESKGTKNQKIYTYDVPTIYHRFLEAKELLKSDNELLIKTTIKKLEILFNEFEDLTEDSILNNIYKELSVNSFNELLSLNKNEILDKLELLEKYIKDNLINPNKWVRLRQSNDEITLTVKCVYIKNDNRIQKVDESEIEVSSLEEANTLLESIGIVRRNYQEKIRHSYKYKGADIEIDEWPLLKPYVEIECDDEDIIDEIISKLELEEKEIVSLNTEQLYKRINIDVIKISDLKFE